MQTKCDITVSLSSEDVEEAVKQYIQKTMGFNVVGKVTLNVGKVSRGFGMNEYDEIIFKSASAKVEPRTTTRSSLGAQIDAVERSKEQR